MEVDGPAPPKLTPGDRATGRLEQTSRLVELLCGKATRGRMRRGQDLILRPLGYECNQDRLKSLGCLIPPGHRGRQGALPSHGDSPVSPVPHGLVARSVARTERSNPRRVTPLARSVCRSLLALSCDAVTCNGVRVCVRE